MPVSNNYMNQPYGPGLSVARPIQYNTLDQLRMAANNQSLMYMQPYTANTVQQLAAMGAGFMGYQNVNPVPVATPGISLYNEVYRAKVTTPMFSVMQANLNRKLGESLAMGVANASNKFGFRPDDVSADKWRRDLTELGGSAPGQFLAATAMQTQFGQRLLGGDINQLYSSVFANRNNFAFRGNQWFNPNSKVQRHIAANYTSGVLDAVMGNLMTTDDGKASPWVANQSILKGRDISQVGALMNAMSIRNPNMFSMDKEELTLMAKAEEQATLIRKAQAKYRRQHEGEDGGLDQIAQEMGVGADKIRERFDALQHGKVLTKDESERMRRKYQEVGKKVAQAMEGMTAIADAIGETDVTKAYARMVDATGGKFDNFTAKQKREFGNQLSAESKVYGVSGATQLDIMQAMGDTYADVAFARDTVTGKNKSNLTPIVADALKQEALLLHKQSGMSIRDATLHVRKYFENSQKSTAGRATKLVEAAYRTGKISTAEYERFNKAVESGDIRKESALLGDLGMEIYGRRNGLIRAIQDPGEMALAEKQLSSLSQDQQIAAARAIVHHGFAGPRQMMVESSKDIARKNAKQLAASIMEDSGGGRALLTEAERKKTEAAEYAGYQLYLQDKINTAATDEERKRYEAKSELLHTRYSKEGMAGARNLVTNSGAFDADRVAMQDRASTEVSTHIVSRAEQAIKEGMGGRRWLQEASAIIGDNNPEVRQIINDALAESDRDPAAASKAMDAVYSLMSDDEKALITDPTMQRKAAGILTTDDFKRKVGTELRKRREKDKTVTWSDVATDLLDKQGIRGAGVDNLVSQTYKLRRANINAHSTKYMEELQRPQVRAKILKLMTSENLSFDQAAPRVLGMPSDSMTQEQLDNIERAAYGAGLSSELFIHGATDQQRKDGRKMIEKQMHDEEYIEKTNRHLRETMAQRLFKSITQDPDSEDKYSIADILGISYDERMDVASKQHNAIIAADQVSSTELAGMSDKEIEKQFKGLSSERIEQLKLMRDESKKIKKATKEGDIKDLAEYMESESGHRLGVLSENHFDTKALDTYERQKADAQKLQKGIEAVKRGDMGELDDVSYEVARKMVADQDGHKSWWHMWANHKQRARAAELAKGVNRQIIDIARGGGDVNADNITDIKDAVYINAASDSAESYRYKQHLDEDEKQAYGSGGAGGNLHVTLDSARIVIDMGGKQYTGTLAGSGTGN